MPPTATANRTSKEETISIRDSDLLALISSWTDLSPTVPLPIGVSVDDAMDRAREFRKAAALGNPLLVDLHDQNESADLIHATCRSLMEDCVGSPRRTLAEASAIRELLANADWPNDQLEEKKSLLGSLAFVAWRAARLLDLSREVHRWEGDYKRAFRESLSSQVIDEWFVSEASAKTAAAHALLSGPECLLQALIYVHDHLETNPRGVSNAVTAIYRVLETGARGMPSDLRLFLLGEACAINGAALRSVGKASEVLEWLDRAEAYFRMGVDPKSGAAKALYLRLIVFHNLSRFDVVAKVAPQLEATFAQLGMEEERVKCRILWSSSLKIEGRPQEALEVLEPVREWRSTMRPVLYGWVLLQSGDTHQILGNYDRALEEFGEAARLLREGKQYVGLADLHLMMSCVYRAQGRLDEALHLLETSRQDHAHLAMTWPDGYHRMLIAETYLAMGRAREAEIEIRAAL